MAHAATCGIITLTLLTFVVVPMLYAYLDDLSRWMRNRRGRQASGT